MSEQSLILADSFIVKGFSEEADALKESALTRSALIGKVANSQQNQDAFGAVSDIHNLLAQIEKAREELKRPALEYGRRLDAKVKQWIEDLKAEELRLNTAMGNYQQHELARLRDATLAANSELAEIEQRRHAALANAETDEERDAIAARFDEEARCVQLPKANKPEGQQIKADFDVQIQDIHELYRFHPNCVKMEPRVSEIKAILNGGGTVKGVVAKPIIKASARVSKQPTAIEI